jgi:hypothetical protein
MPIKQDWVAGMNAMQVAFSLDQIEVDESCTLLIETLESGQYNKQKTDFDRSQALGHCDAAAALLYAWRSVNRDNPYQAYYQAGQNTFVVRSFDDPLNQVSNAIQPKAFGSFKRK